MNKEIIKYRNDLKTVFMKYGMHRAIRSNTLNDLIDEINQYYTTNNPPTEESHEAHLTEQLNGWVKHLESEKDKLKGDSDYHKGVKNGFAKVIEKLKDVTKR